MIELLLILIVGLFSPPPSGGVFTLSPDAHIPRGGAMSCYPCASWCLVGSKP